MEAIETLKQLDPWTILWIIIVILSAWSFLANIFEKTIGKFGIETKGMRQRREDRELLKATTELAKKTDENLDNLQARIETLTEMFLDKEIDDYRWEIVNFATRVSEGRPCNKDSFKHCLRTYEKYETLLEKYGLENGEVELSMEIVNETYKKKLSEGFDYEELF